MLGIAIVSSFALCGSPSTGRGACFVGVRTAHPRSSLSDDAVASKLKAMKSGRGGKQRRRRPRPPASKGAGAGPADAGEAGGAGLPASDHTRVWIVPEALRLPGAPSITEHLRHYSLDELFLHSGLGATFDENAALRRALRVAMRADLYRRPEGWSDLQSRLATELSSSLMVSWRSPRGTCAALTAAFADAGVDLSGDEFVSTLSGLCGDSAHGSLMDIAAIPGRVVAHSWHQDSGVSSMTVMLGFPPSNGYEGGGVFSHAVRLSHPLRPPPGASIGDVYEYERYESAGDGSAAPPEITDEFVVRPVYARGKEVVVWDDSTHLHSAPDRQHRESLWRFM